MRRAIVRVRRKYQITIPREIWEKLGISIGDLLMVSVKDNQIIIKPIKFKVEDPVEQLSKLMKKSMDIDVIKLIEESWNED